MAHEALLIHLASVALRKPPGEVKTEVKEEKPEVKEEKPEVKDEPMPEIKEALGLARISWNEMCQTCFKGLEKRSF